jgi:hypothetical protein
MLFGSKPTYEAPNYRVFFQSCSRSENSCFLFYPQIVIMNGGLSRFFSASSSNCNHSTTSCFTKNSDIDVHTTVVLKGRVVSYTMCAAKFWLPSIWKIIILHILTVRVFHSPVVLPGLKFNIPRFVAAKKTVQWAECFENHWPANIEIITFQPALLCEFF